MLSCSECSKTFTRRFNLLRHMADTCRKPLINKSFKKSSTLPSYDEYDKGSQYGSEKESEENVESQSSDAASISYKGDDNSGKESECTDDGSAESDGSASDLYNQDTFTLDDEDEETDCTITSSDDSDEEKCAEPPSHLEVIPLKWPSKTYYLRSMWRKYGEGEYKLFKHWRWLEDFVGMNSYSVLRKIRHATEGQIEALCEIALNICGGDVYPRMADKSFILKNRHLIKALAKTNISSERKRRLVLERGGIFVNKLVSLIEPLLDDLLDTPDDTENEGSDLEESDGNCEQ